jgi:hypothetical protein
VVKDGRVVDQKLKLKGIHFNHQVSSSFGAAELAAIVQDPSKKASVPQYFIKKQIAHRTVANNSLFKEIKFNSTKRWFVSSDLSEPTLPYGYVA